MKQHQGFHFSDETEGLCNSLCQVAGVGVTGVGSQAPLYHPLREAKGLRWVRFPITCQLGSGLPFRS